MFAINFGNLICEKVPVIKMEETDVDKNEDLNVVRNDPFNLKYSNIYGEIFKYLSGKELLELSLVSKFFYDSIGKSKIAMEKIRLIIKETKQRQFDENMINRTGRMYRNIDIRCLYRNSMLMYELLKKHSLTIKCIQTGYDIEMDDVFFPNLEILKYHATTDHYPLNLVQNGLASATTNLKELHIFGKVPTNDVFHNCLTNNKGLEKLVLEDTAYHVINEINSFYGIQLRSIHCNTVVDNNDNIFWNRFENFLQMSRNSLRDIKLKCSFKKFCEFLTALPHLTSVSYSVSQQFTRYDGKYIVPFNKIKKANFMITNSNFIRAFTIKSPELEEIYIGELCFDDIVKIFDNAPKLRILKYAYIIDGSYTHREVLDYLLSLKQTDKCFGKRDIKIQQI